MLHVSCMRAAVFLFFTLCVLPAQIAGNLKIAFIRVSFEKGDYPGFTGDGNFLLTSSDICDNYIIDPPPHDKNYFQSHIIAVDNYFRSVSYNAFGIDINNSAIFPASNDSSYRLNKPMNYYNELGMEDMHEERIVGLLKDALDIAFEVDQIHFDDFDLIAVIHPGLGQDFNLPFLDPTPEDIPSTFIDSLMIAKNLKEPLKIGNATINRGLILPESQNHPLMDPLIYSSIANPCDIQYSITGTWALMIGFAVGLPPLWNIETGESGIGIFGLMDQGSNNGRGMVPSPPNPWTRIYAGWENPLILSTPQRLSLTSFKKNSIAKIYLNDFEYFLIENRNNWFRHGVDIDSARLAIWETTKDYPNYIDVLFDSTGIIKNDHGVVTEVSNYNIGMPASGILIWHIDESKILNSIESYTINADKTAKGVDLEEADGAQDIGFISSLFTDPSSGYWGDMWFNSNNQFFRSNNINNLEFSNYTYPNTQTNNDYLTSIRIDNFSNTDTIMSFDFNYTNNRLFFKQNNKSTLFQWDVDSDGTLDFIGIGDSLWWSNNIQKSISFKKIHSDEVQLSVVRNSEEVSLAIIEKIQNVHYFSLYSFNPKIQNFTKTWERSIDSNEKITLIGSEDSTVHFTKNQFYYKIDSYELIQEPETFVAISFTGPYGQNIDLSSIGHSYDKFLFDRNYFKYLSLADLDLDNSVDIIAIDTSGNIHAFDENFVKKSGFPILSSAINTVLVSDITGDIYPELIYQQNDKSLIIADYKGKTISSFSLPQGSDLKSVGVYKSRKAVVFSKHIDLFKEWNNSDVYNEWSYQYGSPDFSRTLKIDTSMVVNSSPLLDKSLTYAYPNPSYGENIIIRLQAGVHEGIEIDIYDLAGYKKYSFINNSSVSSLNTSTVIEIPWDIKEVESGVYFARVKVFNKKRVNQKVIKMSIIK